MSRNWKMDAAPVKHVSECFIKPKYQIEEVKQPYYLAPWDLAMLSANYIQKGLLFAKPSHTQDPDYTTTKLLESLKESLSLTLVHFYPLAGQLVTTEVDEDRHQCLVFVDCNKGHGARFIHAALDMTISDILSPTDVPSVVQSFFDHDRAVNHDGHTRPLLSVQVTELIDGIFIGCSVNHMLEHSLGWAALLLHQSVVNCTDRAVRDFLEAWMQSPFVYQLRTLFDSNSVMMGSSPRFDMYGNEFGLGEALAVRSGYANKFVRKVTAYPGYEGGGSVDLEICLPPDSMRALETDEEFTASVSLPYKGY